jgi:hypothetical protein
VNFEGCLIWAALLLVSGPMHVDAQNDQWDQRVHDLRVLDSLVYAVVPLDGDAEMRAAWRLAMDGLQLACGDSIVTRAFTEESWAGEIVALLSIWKDPHLRVAYPLPSLLEAASEARLLALTPMGANGMAGQLAWLSKFQPSDHSGQANQGDRQIALSFDSLSNGQPLANLKIRSFDEGGDGRFARRLRRAIRKVNRRDAVLVIDLRGNTGGLRWRRHALREALGLRDGLSYEWSVSKHSNHSQARVLRASALSREQLLRRARRKPVWAEAARLANAAVGTTDSVLVDRWAGRMPHYGGRAAVLIDALSFSAAVMLASELRASDRFEVFGVPPLGRGDEMSGSSVMVGLPATGLVVALPTTRSFFDPAAIADFGLRAGTSSQEVERQAMLWLSGEKPRIAHRVADALLGATIAAFEPTQELAVLWTDVFYAASLAEDALRARVDSLERSGAPEVEVLAQVGDWHKEIKAVRAQRDAFIRQSLSLGNRSKYDALRTPKRPDVRHFGLHDRLLCGLCKKPSAAIPTVSPVPTLKRNQP